MKILVKFWSDWADELDCQEMLVVEGDSADAVYKRYEEKLGEYKEEGIELGFGTNEAFYAQELDLRSFTFTPLADNEAEIIQRLLGKRFGTGILRHF